MHVQTACRASGVDVKAANRYGVTRSTLACTNGNAGWSQLLLKAGADPNTASAGGETALMTCARTGNVEAVKALLAPGADVTARNRARADGSDVGCGRRSRRNR